MELLDSTNVSELIHDLVHQDTQQHRTHIDLTAQSIHRLSGAGQLDFGGSEFSPALTEPVSPGKKNPDDDYGWWQLSMGTYMVSFNETIGVTQEQLGLIVPHNHLHQTGIVAGPHLISSDLMAQSELRYPIQVPENGVHIKENARVASLLVLTT